MNGALTIGTEDGANVEMREAVTDRWWPFRFGARQRKMRTLAIIAAATFILAMKPSAARWMPSIDGTFAENAQERAAFAAIHHSLLDTRPLFCLARSCAPITKRKRKSKSSISTPEQWAEIAIHNIAAMGRFSSDESIRNYAKLIWDIEPCPIDLEVLARIRREFAGESSDRT